MKIVLKPLAILLVSGLFLTGCGGAATPAGTAPTITTQPANVSIAVGATATFSVVATGTAPLTYQWTKGGTAISGATSASYTTPATVAGDNGSSFTVTATNAVGSVTSSAATLTVTSPPVAPTITTQPLNASVVAGQVATFTVSASGTPAPTYQWRKTGTNISGATTAGYTTPATVLGDNGATFDVVVTNSAGAVTSSAATLTVSAAGIAPVITTQPVGVSADAGASAAFTVVATGSPTPTYQWKKNGTNVASGGTAATYTIAATTPDDAGPYTVFVSNSAGNVTSNAATLTIFYKPIIVSQPGSLSVQPGNGASFSVAANANPAPTYQWRKGGVNISGATNTTYGISNAQVSDDGIYDVVVTNSKGSTTSNGATLAVTTHHSVSGFINVLQGGAAVPGVTVSINTTPTAIIAITDNSGNFTLTNIPDGTYTVTPSLTGHSAIFSPSTRPVTVSGADVNSVQFSASIGYSVSGTISYAGSKTGRIYLAMRNSGSGGGNCCGGPGTSIAAPGSYTIRGVAPGSYRVSASMDVLGFGTSNANDPSGLSSSFTVGAADVSGQDVAIADSSVDLSGTSGPTNVAVFPGNSSAAVFWNSAQTSGLESADHYKIEWSASATFASGITSATVPADGMQLYLQSGLTDGTALYYRMSAIAGSTTSNPSATVGPITIGAPTGGHSVSGTLTYPGTATGPLYVGMFSGTSNTLFVTRIASPTNSQAFTIAGVQPGSYFLFGILDQDIDGRVGVGDLTNTRGKGNNSNITVSSADLTGQTVSLTATAATAEATTSHSQNNGSGDSYSLNIAIDGNVKLPVTVSVTSGPNIVVPQDLSSGDGRGRFSLSPQLGSTRPTVGDSYVFSVTYSDGSSDTNVPATVAAVLDSFPTNLHTSGTSTTPTFNWTAPANPPASYTYFFGLYQSGGGQIWQFPGRNNNGIGLPSTATSLNFNSDGHAFVSALTTGVTYNWNLSVQDTNGNVAQQQASFAP